MTKIRFIALAAIAAFIISPAVASAESPTVSYSAKKRGGVVFKDKTEDKVSASEETTDDMHPADIEPAAGGSEPATGEEKDALAESMKLPRK